MGVGVTTTSAKCESRITKYDPLAFINHVDIYRNEYSRTIFGMSIDQTSPPIDVDFDPCIGKTLSLEKDWKLPMKFVVFDRTADTLRRMVRVFIDGIDHNIEAESVEEENRDKKLLFVGAGRNARSKGEYEWGSITCRKKYKKDRPNDSAEAARLLIEITEAINAKIAEVKGMSAVSQKE